MPLCTLGFKTLEFRRPMRMWPDLAMAGNVLTRLNMLALEALILAGLTTRANLDSEDSDKKHRMIQIMNKDKHMRTAVMR